MEAPVLPGTGRPLYRYLSYHRKSDGKQTEPCVCLLSEGELKQTAGGTFISIRRKKKHMQLAAALRRLLSVACSCCQPTESGPKQNQIEAEYFRMAAAVL